MNYLVLTVLVLCAAAVGFVAGRGEATATKRALDLREQELLSSAHKRERDISDSAKKKEQDLLAAEARSLAAIDAHAEEVRAWHASVEADVARQRADLEALPAAWTAEHERQVARLMELVEAFDNGFLRGRSWLAAAFAEYVDTVDMSLELNLLLKEFPAPRAAEAVAEMRTKRREMAYELKMLQYQVATYEEYFPDLVEFREAILDEPIDLRRGALASLEDTDPALALGFVSAAEYRALEAGQRNQLALDRYWGRTKSKVEIGRLFERFIGYLYESEGWHVEYHGAIKGFDDFGRDLICTRNGSTEIVQCKCWSHAKLIREKHVMQLFGTTVLYGLSAETAQPEPVLVCTTELSPEAAAVAKLLKVRVVRRELERYPMIKCNLNPATGQRIYHLPFDQQYDRVVIGNQPGEFYAATVAEAETAGFRRALRWHGTDG